MTKLIIIGRSKGVLIPHQYIKSANLEGHDLEFELHTDGLLLKPAKPSVQGGRIRLHRYCRRLNTILIKNGLMQILLIANKITGSIVVIFFDSYEPTLIS